MSTTEAESEGLDKALMSLNTEVSREEDCIFLL